MREIVDFMKELLLLKKEDKKLVGLTSFKRARKPVIPKARKKVSKEVKLSDLMRRA
ncbi:MAG: hypothetical protein KHX03_08500 [Clostridium sp.]|nr:hypothetical protein [Clostridium sp.]